MAEQRMSTIVDPRIKSADHRSSTKHDYITVPTISLHGTWPVVHMIDEDTFVQMAILAHHITADARKRYAHSREN